MPDWTEAEVQTYVTSLAPIFRNHIINNRPQGAPVPNYRAALRVLAALSMVVQQEQAITSVPTNAPSP